MQPGRSVKECSGYIESHLFEKEKHTERVERMRWHLEHKPYSDKKVNDGREVE